LTNQIFYGKLDITFYRDDIRKELHIPNQTDIKFSIEGKKVVLIDDVLYTGRTIRAALDALMDYGRPEKVELMVLIDRRYSRQLPIQADYIGKSIDSIVTQKVKVLWKEKDENDEVRQAAGEALAKYGPDDLAFALDYAARHKVDPVWRAALDRATGKVRDHRRGRRG